MKPLHVWGRGAMMHTFQHRQGSCGPRVGPPHTGCPPGLGMEKWEKLEQAGWGGAGGILRSRRRWGSELSFGRHFSM